MIYLELLIYLSLIFANGLLSMSEIAVVSARRARLQRRAEEGSAGAKVALELVNDSSRFLSTVQIGITLIGILTGVFGGATLGEQLANVLAEVPILSPYSETISVIIVVVITTYLSLVFGELAPKQIGLINPERVAISVSRPLSTISRITSPLVKLLSWSTTAVLRFLRIGSKQDATVTEDEVRFLIGQGTETGVFEPIEEELVDQVFRMSDQRMSALITPRTEVTWIDLDDPIDTNLEKIVSSGYSLFPVMRENPDNTLGYLRAVDLLAQCLSGEPLSLTSILQPAHFIPERVPVFDVLKGFRDRGVEMAFSMDEYGGIEGIVTLQDIVETIIGEIREAEDILDPNIVQREDGSWLLDGMLSIGDFKELLGIKDLTKEDGQYYETLGGYVMTCLGRIPKSGDIIEQQGIRIEVVDMDKRRVDKVLVNRVEQA